MNSWFDSCYLYRAMHLKMLEEWKKQSTATEYVFLPSLFYLFYCCFDCDKDLFVQSCLALQANHPQALTNLGNIYMEW